MPFVVGAGPGAESSGPGYFGDLRDVVVGQGREILLEKRLGERLFVTQRALVGVEFFLVVGPPDFGRRRPWSIEVKVTLDSGRAPVDVRRANALGASNWNRAQFVQWRKMCSPHIAETAEELGCTRQTFSRLLNGRTGISPTMALALERIGWSNAGFWVRRQAQYDLAQERIRQNQSVA